MGVLYTMAAIKDSDKDGWWEGEVRSIVPDGTRTPSIRVPPLSGVYLPLHIRHVRALVLRIRISRRARLEIECTQMCGAAVPFTVCGVCTYMAANCAATAIRALISRKIVKSEEKFVRIQNARPRAVFHDRRCLGRRNSLVCFANSEKIQISSWHKDALVSRNV